MANDSPTLTIPSTANRFASPNAIGPGTVKPTFGSGTSNVYLLIFGRPRTACIEGCIEAASIHGMEKSLNLSY